MKRRTDETFFEQTTRATGSSTRADGVENMVKRSTIFHGVNEAAVILGQNFVSARYLSIDRHVPKY